MEPPEKRAKALAGLSEAAESSSDEEGDLLLPVDEEMGDESADEEVMVPRGPKSTAAVSYSTPFFQLGLTFFI